MSAAASAKNPQTPILMLTARGDAMDRVVGLEMGADDYLPKPFEPRELLARLRALLRRAEIRAASPTVLRFGRLEIDAGAHQVRLDGEEKSITGYQFALLLALAQNAGRVLSRDALMTLLKNEALEAFDRSIDVHISRIRAAIEDEPEKAEAASSPCAAAAMCSPRRRTERVGARGILPCGGARRDPR
jgi:two-component system phosphate regulon response regulator OmpR